MLPLILLVRRIVSFYILNSGWHGMLTFFARNGLCEHENATFRDRSPSHLCLGEASSLKFNNVRILIVLR
jgi:hypothetical protein